MTANDAVSPPPADDRPPRDFPDEGSYAVIRSVGSLRVWNDLRWRWDGHDWQPVAVSGPPADDQAARLADAVRVLEDEVTPDRPLHTSDELLSSLTLVLAEYDRRGKAIRDLGTQNRVLRESRDRWVARSAALSGLLRGMARRVGVVRGVSAEDDASLRAVVDELSAQLNSVYQQRDTYAAREEHALHVRDVALARLNENIGKFDKLQSWYRDSIANRDSSINRLLGQVAAVRALADELDPPKCPEHISFVGKQPDCAACVAWWASSPAREARGMQLRAVLDGPTDDRTQILADLAPILSDALDDIRAAVGLPADTSEPWMVVDAVRRLVGPAEAAEPAPVVSVPDEMLRGQAPQLSAVFESQRLAEAGAPEPAERIVRDDFGGEWLMCARQECGLQVVRPGKVQCWCDSKEGRLDELHAAPCDCGCRGVNAVPGRAGSVTTTPADPAEVPLHERPEDPEMPFRYEIEVWYPQLDGSHTWETGRATPADLAARLRHEADMVESVGSWTYKPPVETALIGTWADPAFVAHQDHKHAVDGCGYCPSEEDR